MSDHDDDLGLAAKTPWNKVNRFMAHYPLTFSVLVLAVALLTIAITVGVSLSTLGGGVDRSSARIERVERHNCLEAAFDFALADFVDALVSSDPKLIETASAAQRAAAIDLVRNATAQPTDPRVLCAPEIPTTTTTTPGG